MVALFFFNRFFKKKNAPFILFNNNASFSMTKRVLYNID